MASKDLLNVGEEWFVAVHVGAGYHHPDNASHYRSLCSCACLKAKDILAKGGAAVDAAMVAVKMLEDSESCNAGNGSNLNADGQVQCDASIMDGTTGAFGSLAAAPGVQNPIEAAYHVMIQEAGGLLDLGLVPPMCLAGDGARVWANHQGLSTCTSSDTKGYHVTGKATQQYEEYKSRLAAYRQDGKKDNKIHKPDIDNSQSEINTPTLEGNQGLEVAPKRRKVALEDTVGAVCLDNRGRVAAAVSSGGLWLKVPGRVGEAGMYGCGCWADNMDSNKPSFACSISGTGEHISKALLAHSCANYFDQTSDLHEAIGRTMQKGFLECSRLKHLQRKMAGIIALAVDGKDLDFLWAHTTESFGLGYMSHGDKNPKTMVSRLTDEHLAGTTYLTGGIHVVLETVTRTNENMKG